MKTMSIIGSMAAFMIGALAPQIADAQYAPGSSWFLTSCTTSDSHDPRGYLRSHSHWDVMQGFAMWFGDLRRNGKPKVEDHKLMVLGIFPSANLTPEPLWINLADASGYDKTCGWVATVPGIAKERIVGVVRRGCKGSGMCVLPLEMPRARDSVFALEGFSFLKQDHHDTNIRTIEIRADLRHRKVGVRFTDNGGFTYVAEVYYAYLPAATVAGQYVVSGSRLRKMSALRLGRRPGQAVLQGFRFNFRNGDHHFGMMYIDPLGDSYVVSFRDKNLDDNFDVGIRYAILR